MSLSYNCLIIGDSGQGKSSSLMNLDRERSVVINTEGKKLPFRNSQFKYELIPESFSQLKSSLEKSKKLVKDGLIDIVVVDSLFGAQELAMESCKKMFSGFEVFGMFSEIIMRMMKDSTLIGVPVIFTSPAADFEDHGVGIESITKRRAMFLGKALGGKIEREFNIVLYCDNQPNEDGEIQYQFRTKTDGRDTAKAPMGMFDDFGSHMPNDISLILKAILKY